MKRTDQDEERTPTDLIEEACALLSLIDSTQSDDTPDEDPAARKARLAMRALAGRMVAEMAAGLRGGARAPLRRSFLAAAA